MVINYCGGFDTVCTLQSVEKKKNRNPEKYGTWIANRFSSLNELKMCLIFVTEKKTHSRK